jgi:hypothetical protein
MKNIKLLTGYVSKSDAAKLKSFYLAKFKKEGRKDLRVVIENASAFKVKDVKLSGDFIVVAYLKSQCKVECKKVLENVVKKVVPIIRKAKTIQQDLPKPVFVPVKRFINFMKKDRMQGLKQRWVWKFIQSPVKLSA